MQTAAPNLPQRALGFSENNKKSRKQYARRRHGNRLVVGEGVRSVVPPLPLSHPRRQEEEGVRSEFGAASELRTNLHPIVADVERRGNCSHCRRLVLLQNKVIAISFLYKKSVFTFFCECPTLPKRLHLTLRRSIEIGSATVHVQ